MNTIHLITLGGTIDKRYDPVSATLDVGAPVLAEILSTAGLPADELTLSAFARKDSLEMSEGDRAGLAAFVAGSPADRVLLVHGTDTMQDSAARIAQVVQGKTVVLTGAMVPHCIAGSDAAFNVGVAFAAVQLLPAGVYIAMHGQVLPHTQYRKDRALGRFVEVSD